LHFLPPAEADTIVAAFRHLMAPGSYLIASSGTSTGTSPALINRLAAAYQDTATVTGRTVDEIAAYFTGLHLVPPGLTDVWAWRPDTQHHWPQPRSARILGAVGRKPAPPTAVTDRTAQAIARNIGQDGQDPAQPTSSPDAAFSDLTQRPGAPPNNHDHGIRVQAQLWRFYRIHVLVYE
jgi:hypothetical protein